MNDSYQALQQRDPEAWDAFYREHVHELYGFVFRLVRGDHPAAADVFQDIWLSAIDHIGQFNPDRGEFRAWLFGIARQKVAWYWRQRTTSKNIAAARPDRATDEVEGAILPDDILGQLEQAAVVRAALLAMPPERRQALTDKYVEGFSVDRIAANNGKSPKAVESLLTRAREQLRSSLQWYFTSPKGEWEP